MWIRTCLLVALVACGAGARATSTLPASLARFHEASGGDRWDRVRVMVSRAELEGSGLTGTLESVEDVTTGRFHATFDLGAYQVADGDDGTVAWHRSPGGEVVLAESAEAIARARTAAWMLRRGYFDAAGATYEPIDGGGLRATPDGGEPIELWFDEATGLLAKTRSRQGTRTIETRFEDYREVDGVRVPFRVVHDEGDPRNLFTVRYTEIRFEDSTDETAFAPPALDADRVSFVDGARSTDVRFDLINNHIYVDATVDGQPVRMLVDTGGANVLTPAAAKRLGLASEGKGAVGGAGAKQADLAFARGKELGVGQIRLADPLFYVIDFGALADVEGVDFDGLVGFELFSRLIVRIDYPGGLLTLSRVEDFAPPAGATPVKFELADRIPGVDGSVDGVPARFMIDTGSRKSVTLSSPFVKEHGLVETYDPGFEAVTGWGVGGEVRSWPVRFREVALGDAVVRDVAGDLFTGTEGAFADPDWSGNIGSGFLKRFVVTFDYAGRTMYLAPASPALPREIYDRAGMFLIRDGDAVRIVAVTAKGPAEKAGLAVDDRIVTIDGTPAGDRPVHEWRRVLGEGAIGEKHTLELERAGKRKKVTLVLTELLP